MKSNIKNLGSIKDIVRDPDLVKSIIVYNGDRHYFKAFIDLVNEGLESGELYPDDLGVFNSGEVADAIVNIDRTVRKYGFRNAYPAEKLDKLNYLSTINDPNSFAASFTHPEILEAMADNQFSELTQWSKGSVLPPVTAFATIVSELLEQGNMDAAKSYLNEVAYFSKKYSQANRKNNSFESKSKPLVNTVNQENEIRSVEIPVQNTINSSNISTEDDLINQINLVIDQYEQDKATIYSSNIVSDEILNRALAEMAMEDGTSIDTANLSRGSFRK